VSGVAVYNPEMLELMQSIYREVMISDFDLGLSEHEREHVAQEILRLVAYGRCERDEIVTTIRSWVERRGITGRPLDDVDQSAKPHYR
jgi:hypothetical protein